MKKRLLAGLLSCGVLLCACGAQEAAEESSAVMSVTEPESSGQSAPSDDPAPKKSAPEAEDAGSDTESGAEVRSMVLTDAPKALEGIYWKGNVRFVPALDLTFTVPEPWLKMPDETLEQSSAAMEGCHFIVASRDILDYGIRMTVYFSGETYGAKDIREYMDRYRAAMEESGNFLGTGNLEWFQVGDYEIGHMFCVQSLGEQGLLAGCYAALWGGDRPILINLEFSDALDHEAMDKSEDVLKSMIRQTADVTPLELAGDRDGHREGLDYIFDEIGMKITAPENMKERDVNEIYPAYGGLAPAVYKVAMTDASAEGYRMLVVMGADSNGLTARQLLEAGFAGADDSIEVDEIEERTVNGFDFQYVKTRKDMGDAVVEQIMMIHDRGNDRNVTLLYAYNVEQAAAVESSLDKLITKV